MLSREIRQFVTVVESKSINSASQRLNVSQPSVSKTLQNLEHELGVQLFERSIRGVNLTPEGEILYEHALKLLEEEGKTLVEIKRLKEIKNRNQITIGKPYSNLDTYILKNMCIQAAKELRIQQGRENRF